MSEDTSVPVTDAIDTEQSSGRPKGRRGLIVGISVAVVLLVALAAGGVWYVARRNAQRSVDGRLAAAEEHWKVATMYLGAAQGVADGISVSNPELAQMTVSSWPVSLARASANSTIALDAALEDVRGLPPSPGRARYIQAIATARLAAEKTEEAHQALVLAPDLSRECADFLDASNRAASKSTAALEAINKSKWGQATSLARDAESGAAKLEHTVQRLKALTAKADPETRRDIGLMKRAADLERTLTRGTATVVRYGRAGSYTREIAALDRYGKIAKQLEQLEEPMLLSSPAAYSQKALPLLVKARDTLYEADHMHSEALLALH